MNLYSIGHSNHEIGPFLRLLQQAGVAAVADVRSQPYSRRLPHYNRPDLEERLRAHGLAYVFLGEYLGGRPEDMDLYHADGRVNYELVRKSYLFQQGLERLARDLETRSIAMLCSEEDPLDCHRGLMIAPALLEIGILTIHLRGNGSVESMEAMEDRLLQETGVGASFRDGLFAVLVTPEDRRAMLTEAYRFQAKRKAFRLRTEEENQ